MRAARERNPKAGHAAFDSDFAVLDALRRDARAGGAGLTVEDAAVAAGVTDHTARIILKELVLMNHAKVSRGSLPRFNRYSYAEKSA